MAPKQKPCEDTLWDTVNKLCGSVENDLVDNMIALPGQLFDATQIPVCLWFITKNKSGKADVPVGKEDKQANGDVGAPS